MNKIIYTVVAVIAAIVVGILIGRSMGGSMNAAGSGASGGDREVLYWVAPMDANYRRDEAGKSPMGMDLVAVYADEVDGQPGVVSIDPNNREQPRRADGKSTTRVIVPENRYRRLCRLRRGHGATSAHAR